jgi:hypothetical protein
MLSPCLVCTHGFSWRIAPLERVCAQCGSLHVLKSGVWSLGSRPNRLERPVATARATRQVPPRFAVMKVVPNLEMPAERKASS